MRILALSPGVPAPLGGGGLSRTFHLLKALTPHHAVALAACTGDDASVAEEIGAILRDGVDLVMIGGAPLARYLPLLPWGVPRVLDLHEIRSLAAQRALSTAAGDADVLARDADSILQWERDAVRHANLCLTVSEAHATAARVMLDAPVVEIVPNGVDTEHFAPVPARAQRGAVLFSGAPGDPPDAQAARAFAAQVFPLVLREMPHATFHVVGPRPSDGIAPPGGDGIAVYGPVEDTRPHYRNAEVVVFPARRVGPTSHILQAAAAGKAIVTGPSTLEGLRFTPGRDLVVADSPGAFASAVLALLRDPAQRADLGAHARAMACSYDWAVIGRSFRLAIERCAARTSPAA